MIVLTVVTAPETGKGRLMLPRRVDRLGKGLPNLYLGTELPRFSSGSSKDRSGMERTQLR
jgi:hypothetical protein